MHLKGPGPQRISAIISPIVVLLSSISLSAELEYDYFERHIRPVLVEKCYACHSRDAAQIEGSLRVDDREAIRAGGDSGPAVSPHDVDGSLLIDAISYNGLEMPPDAKLPADVVAHFRHWIELGAPDPRDPVPATPATAATANRLTDASDRWAFQPPREQPLPPAGHAKSRSRVDRFLAGKIEAAKLEMAASADRRTLARRLSFAITGLPPTASTVQDFLDDHDPRAYEALVDRLLASPLFGEHFARMWLDVARYAEDQAHIVGNDESLFYPNAYLYRDWVIAAFNEDLPFDRFVQLQLAADLISPDDPQALTALGFIGLGPKYYNRGRLEVKADEWEDRVDTVTRGLLGLTVACARCHDHKYDPIQTADYYALAGVFASTAMYNRPLTADLETNPNGEAKSPKDAMHIIREADPVNLRVFIRGNVENQGDEVHRGFLAALCQDDVIQFQEGSGRLELARLLTHPDSRLTARVYVNRVWDRLVGRPIVNTPSNFGASGQPATHPELLDDLAFRFVEQGWSTKWLVREIVNSEFYRRSSVPAGDPSTDPENRLLSHMHRQRMSVEMWRDQLLHVAGLLESSVGGHSLDPLDLSARRRTVYSTISRFQLHPMLALFDFPDANVHAARRSTTISPLQKLFVMNHPWTSHVASAIVSQLPAPDSEAAVRDGITALYQQLWNRPPDAPELELGLSYVMNGDEDRSSQWQHYVQALISTNETHFVD